MFAEERKFLIVEIAVGDWINLDRKVASRERIFEMVGLLSKERISSREDVWFSGF